MPQTSPPAPSVRPETAASYTGDQRSKDTLRKALQDNARESIALLDSFLTLEKLATSQPGSKRPEDIRKELFEAFGGVPRMQQLHMVATQLKRQGFDDEALQLLNKTLAVARWGGENAQPITRDLLDTLNQIQTARGGGAPR